MGRGSGTHEFVQQHWPKSIFSFREFHFFQLQNLVQRGGGVSRGGFLPPHPVVVSRSNTSLCWWKRLVVGMVMGMRMVMVMGMGIVMGWGWHWGWGWGFAALSGNGMQRGGRKRRAHKGCSCPAPPPRPKAHPSPSTLDSLNTKWQSLGSIVTKSEKVRSTCFAGGRASVRWTWVATGLALGSGYTTSNRELPRGLAG